MIMRNEVHGMMKDDARFKCLVSRMPDTSKIQTVYSLVPLTGINVLSCKIHTDWPMIMLYDTYKYWQILINTGTYWQILLNPNKYIDILTDTLKYWWSHVIIFQFLDTTFQYMRKTTFNWSNFSHMLKVENQFERGTVRL